MRERERFCFFVFELFEQLRMTLQHKTKRACMEILSHNQPCLFIAFIIMLNTIFHIFIF
jgi:hypothetical protein